MRYFPIEGNIMIFKTLTILKIVHLGLIISVPYLIIKLPYIIKELYLTRAKAQNKTLYFTKYLLIRWT